MNTQTESSSFVDFFISFPGIILSFFAFAFLIILVMCLFQNDPTKKYWSRVYAKWMHFAEILSTIVMSTVLSLLYFLIVPFFVFLFLKKEDVLGFNSDEESFWKDSKPVSFDLKRNYKLY